MLTIRWRMECLLAITDTFQKVVQFIAIDGLFQTSKQMVADGFFDFGMKALPGGAEEGYGRIGEREIPDGSVIQRDAVDIQESGQPGIGGATVKGLQICANLNCEAAGLDESAYLTGLLGIGT
jgi:hypothetical protein